MIDIILVELYIYNTLYQFYVRTVNILILFIFFNRILFVTTYILVYLREPQSCQNEIIFNSHYL